MAGTPTSVARLTGPPPPRAEAAIVSGRPRPADDGRIEGAVVISHAIATPRPDFRIYAAPGPGSQAPKVRDDSIAELQNVVIYIQSDAAHAAPADAAPPDPPREMVQRNEQFVPHVLPIRVGDAVTFPNDDDVYHNVFSLSAPHPFEIRRYPKGASPDTEVFAKPGIVQVFCHIHSDMSAVILVLGNAWFATPDRTGHYVIDGIPPGEYTLVAWHQRITPIARAGVRVVAGQAATQNFTIPLPAGAPH